MGSERFHRRVIADLVSEATTTVLPSPIRRPLGHPDLTVEEFAEWSELTAFDDFSSTIQTISSPLVQEHLAATLPLSDLPDLLISRRLTPEGFYAAVARFVSRRAWSLTRPLADALFHRVRVSCPEFFAAALSGSNHSAREVFRFGYNFSSSIKEHFERHPADAEAAASALSASPERVRLLMSSHEHVGFFEALAPHLDADQATAIARTLVSSSSRRPQDPAQMLKLVGSKVTDREVRDAGFVLVTRSSTFYSELEQVFGMLSPDDRGPTLCPDLPLPSREAASRLLALFDEGSFSLSSAGAVLEVLAVLAEGLEKYDNLKPLAVGYLMASPKLDPLELLARCSERVPPFVMLRLADLRPDVDWPSALAHASDSALMALPPSEEVSRQVVARGLNGVDARPHLCFLAERGLLLPMVVSSPLPRMLDLLPFPEVRSLLIPWLSQRIGAAPLKWRAFEELAPTWEASLDDLVSVLPG